MKTAVSIPEDVYASAERLAKRLRRTRSRVYTDALREYLVRHDPDAITAALDRVVAEVGGGADPAVSAAARRMLARTEW